MFPNFLLTTDIIMIVVVSLTVGRCRSDSVHRRPVLGSVGVFIVVAAALAAYGVNSGFGEGSRQMHRPYLSFISVHAFPPDYCYIFLSRLFPNKMTFICSLSFNCTTFVRITAINASIMADVPFTLLSMILPFILVGIGVNDMVSPSPPLYNQKANNANVSWGIRLIEFRTMCLNRRQPCNFVGNICDCIA